MRRRTPRRMMRRCAVAAAAPSLVIASAFLTTHFTPRDAAAAGARGGAGRTTWLVFDRGRAGEPVIPTASQLPRAARPLVFVQGAVHGAVPRAMGTADLFTSYSAFRRELRAGAFPKGARYVAYDPEKWSKTPLQEQLRPRRYMERFTALARRHDLRTILVPGRDLLLVNGAGCRKSRGKTLDQAFVYCDVASGASGAQLFVVQSAPEETDAQAYISLLRRVSRQVRRASPTTTVVATLATGGVPLARLVRLADRALRYVDGFEVNTSPSTVRTTSELMRQVGT